MIARARIQESIVEGLALHPRVALLGLRQCGKTTLARPVTLGAGARIFDLENYKNKDNISVEEMNYNSLLYIHSLRHFSHLWHLS
jgi:predicted AAA+ superfamily ATPase